MSFVKLPDDILILIIKKLDIKSLYNLCAAADRICNILCSYGILKNLNFSRSGVATVDIFNSHFFRVISLKNVKELNLCGVRDVTKTRLLSIAKRLQCLHKLDVTYTSINILDLVHIYKVCPTIKDIAVNLEFDNFKSKLDERTFYPCQEMFKNFSNIHFVGSLYSIIYAQLLFFILKDTTPKTLDFTIYKLKMFSSIPINCNEKLQFDKCSMYFLNTRFLDTVHRYNFSDYYGTIFNLLFFKRINLEEYEKIMLIGINNFSKPECYGTPIFEPFFKEFCKLNMNEFQITETFSNVQLCGNSCVMLWRKASTTFDDQFFSDLWSKIIPFFPYSFVPLKIPVNPQYHSYVISPTSRQSDCDYEFTRFGFKKRRLVPPNYVLSYDTEFQQKSDLKLYLVFRDDIKIAVTLPRNGQYLKNLTFLSLSGIVRYSSDYFNILFECCTKLHTLAVDSPSISSCSQSISQCLHLSKTLKNLALIDKRINFQKLFLSISKCTSLENVHIVDLASKVLDMSDPSVVYEKCVNLYCFYIYGLLTKAAQSKFNRFSSKKSISTKILDTSENCFMCEPYFDVFNFNLMKKY